MLAESILAAITKGKESNNYGLMIDGITELCLADIRQRNNKAISGNKAKFIKCVENTLKRHKKECINRPLFSHVWHKDGACYLSNTHYYFSCPADYMEGINPDLIANNKDFSNFPDLTAYTPDRRDLPIEITVNHSDFKAIKAMKTEYFTVNGTVFNTDTFSFAAELLLRFDAWIYGKTDGVITIRMAGKGFLTPCIFSIPRLDGTINCVVCVSRGIENIPDMPCNIISESFAAAK